MNIEIKISKKRISYKKAMLFLNKRVDEVKNGKKRELLWILEHPTTYTAGVSFNQKEILDKKNEIVRGLIENIPTKPEPWPGIQTK